MKEEGRLTQAILKIQNQKRDQLSIILIFEWKPVMKQILLKILRFIFAMESFQIEISSLDMDFVLKITPMNMYGSNFQ